MKAIKRRSIFWREEFNMNNMMTLPIDYANRALAKEEILDRLVEDGIIDAYEINDLATENPFWEKYVHYEEEEYYE